MNWESSGFSEGIENERAASASRRRSRKEARQSCFLLSPNTFCQVKPLFSNYGLLTGKSLVIPGGDGIQLSIIKLILLALTKVHVQTKPIPSCRNWNMHMKAEAVRDVAFLFLPTNSARGIVCKWQHSWPLISEFTYTWRYQRAMTRRILKSSENSATFDHKLYSRQNFSQQQILST